MQFFLMVRILVHEWEDWWNLCIAAADGGPNFV